VPTTSERSEGRGREEISRERNEHHNILN